MVILLQCHFLLENLFFYFGWTSQLIAKRPIISSGQLFFIDISRGTFVLYYVKSFQLIWYTLHIEFVIFWFSMLSNEESN